MWLNLAQLSPEAFAQLRADPKRWLDGIFGSTGFGFPGFDRGADVFGADWRALEQALRLSYAASGAGDDLDWNTADIGGDLPDGMVVDPVWRATLGEHPLEGYEFSRGPAYWFSAGTVREMAEQLAAQHGPEARDALRKELQDEGLDIDLDAAPHLATFAALGEFFARAAAHGRVVIGGLGDREGGR